MEGSLPQAAPHLQAEGLSSFSLCLPRWGWEGCAAAKSERRQRWSGMALSGGILQARQPHPTGGEHWTPPGGELWGSSHQSTAQRFCTSVYLCCFLATETESSFGQKFQPVMGMSAVLCSFIFFQSLAFCKLTYLHACFITLAWDL